MAKTQLILVRHGETEDNHRRVFQGHGGRGLNERGRDQASRLAARFERVGLRAAALYCSDLERAHETASLLSGALSLTPITDSALREIHVGAWQGLDFAKIAETFPEEWASWRRGEDIKRGGGETYTELGHRIGAAMDSFAAAHAGETVVIVSHGAAIKSFVGRVLGLDVAGLRRYRVPSNTGVTVVEREDGLDNLVLWNDASHLDDPLIALQRG